MKAQATNISRPCSLRIHQFVHLSCRKFFITFLPIPALLGERDKLYGESFKCIPLRERQLIVVSFLSYNFALFLSHCGKVKGNNYEIVAWEHLKWLVIDETSTD